MCWNSAKSIEEQIQKHITQLCNDFTIVMQIQYKANYHMTRILITNIDIILHEMFVY